MTPPRAVVRRYRERRAGAERGAVLLALLLPLAGGGALWLASRHALSPSGVEPVRARLLAARRALLSHAAAYPESYGPGGAGPAHLPCPDTDTPLAANALAPLARPASPFRGDGPDPPCGSGTIAVGRLPRHVSLPSHRELFHRESRQHLVYAVSVRAINNPPGRIVDALHRGRTEGDPLADDPVVALIVDVGGAPLPSLERRAANLESGDPLDLLATIRRDVARHAGAGPGRSIAYATLRRSDLLAPARRRVAAWFVANLHRPPTADVCTSYTGDALLAWLGDASSPDASAEDHADADAGAGAGADDRSEPALDCNASSAPRPETIERTPSERHWFVRDRWHRLVALRIAAACRDARHECRAVREPDVGTALRFRLIPTGSPPPSPVPEDDS